MGKTYAAAAMALHPSNFGNHHYCHPQVIIDGSARLGKDNKVTEFLELLGVLITNGEIVDNWFAIVQVILGSGKKNVRELKDVPVNMTMLGGYIKISEKSLEVF